MFRVVSCLSNDHDHGLLLVAVLICVLGSWVAIKTFIKARKEDDQASRVTWIAIATVSTASTVWATHFVAMLAYRPALQVGWNIPLSIASLVLAAAFSAAGIAVGANRKLALAPELGGAILGAGIAVMHYTGMEAFQIAGSIHWDLSYVAVSLLAGFGFGALSLSRASRPVSHWCKYGATLCLILAIAGLHFTGMTAVTLVADPSVPVDTGASSAAFGYLVAGIAMIVIGTNFMAYLVDRRLSAAAIKRMRKLANATPEGIVIVRNGRISDANDRFVDLSGRELPALIGSVPTALWSPVSNVAVAGREVIEGELRNTDREAIPVEITATCDGQGETIYAIRDLRVQRADAARMEHMAHHDHLTGTLNRNSFNALVETATAGDAPFAVFFIDLDRFKEVNDRHGHAIGDAVLVEMARRMQSALPGTALARLGGDEFAMLRPLPHRDAEDGAQMVAAALKHSMDVNGVTVKLGASVGVAHFPKDGRDVDTLLTHADLAMYAAKSDRQSGVRHFDGSMGEAAQRTRILSHDLMLSIERNEMQAYYQVQTDVQTRAATGFEALLRWNHPTLGLISPGEFIPLAEENGSIREIGEWILRRACTDAASWPAPLRVAVNLSPVQLRSDIAPLIASALADSGLAPERLEIEITESILINDFDQALTVLRAIKALGVTIAMDDFGTGYSSLSSLQAFPFDKLKIDRSFVDQLDRMPQAAAIVRAVVNLGLSLEIPVLAEGVENQAHLDFLRSHGCASAQGYLFGKPTPYAGTLRFTATTEKDEKAA